MGPQVAVAGQLTLVTAFKRAKLKDAMLDAIKTEMGKVDINDKRSELTYYRGFL